MSVLISSLAGGWFTPILDAIRERRLRPVLSNALLEEFTEVASRPRMRKWFAVGDAADFAEALRSQSDLGEPAVSVTACRDPDDDYLLALAQTSKADYLVTRDEDLLVLREWHGTAIIPPSQFLQALSNLAPETG